MALFMYGYFYEEISKNPDMRTIKKWPVILGTTLFVGVMWEFAEWISTFYNSLLTIGNLDDTIFDLAADLFGAAVLLLLHPFGSRNSQNI